MRAQTLFKATCTKCMVQPYLQHQPQSQQHQSTVQQQQQSSGSGASLVSLENANSCFQVRFCELRSEQVRLYVHLVLSVLTHVTVPPPVFQLNAASMTSAGAAGAATAPRSAVAAVGRVAQQLKHSVNELHKLNQKYRDLLTECFDADHHTINILNM